MFYKMINFGKCLLSHPIFRQTTEYRFFLSKRQKKQKKKVVKTFFTEHFDCDPSFKNLFKFARMQDCQDNGLLEQKLIKLAFMVKTHKISEWCQ